MPVQKQRRYGWVSWVSLILIALIFTRYKSAPRKSNRNRLAGYCPGTGLAAFATGRKDALFFTIGGLLGAFVYMLAYGWLAENTPLFNEIVGGAVSIANTGNEKYPALLASIPGTVIGIGFGAVMIAIAFALPLHILGKKKESDI
ncbi:MAG: hypothetical protein ACLFP8_09310 [Alphaproteobacteria bacterium]